jgi:hypothetical protein
VCRYIERLQAHLTALGKLYDLQTLYGDYFPPHVDLPVAPSGELRGREALQATRQLLLAATVAPVPPSRFLPPRSAPLDDGEPVPPSLPLPVEPAAAPAAAAGGGATAPSSAAEAAPLSVRAKSSRYWTDVECARYESAVAEMSLHSYADIAAVVGTKDAQQVRSHMRSVQKAAHEGRTLAVHASGPRSQAERREQVRAKAASRYQRWYARMRAQKRREVTRSVRTAAADAHAGEVVGRGDGDGDGDGDGGGGAGVGEAWHDESGAEDSAVEAVWRAAGSAAAAAAAARAETDWERGRLSPESAGE